MLNIQVECYAIFETIIKKSDRSSQRSTRCHVVVEREEEHPNYHRISKNIFMSIESGRNTGVCSSLSLLEALVQPSKQNNDVLVNQFSPYLLPTLISKEQDLQKQLLILEHVSGQNTP